MLMTTLHFPLLNIERAEMKKETVGDRIKRARERAGLNQSELGRRVGVKPQAVQQWESGSNLPADRERYIQIAKVLEVTPYWLEYGELSTPDGFDPDILECVISAVRGAEMELGDALPASVHAQIVRDLYMSCTADFAGRAHAKASVPAFARTIVARALAHR